MPDVFMPRLSDTMEEGTIAQWLFEEGATVDRGAILAEIETDKAVMDLEAYEGGVLEKILVQVGETVPIGEKIAVIGDGSGSSGASSNGGAAAAQGGGDDGGAASGASRPQKAAEPGGPAEPESDESDGAPEGAESREGAARDNEAVDTESRDGEPGESEPSESPSARADGGAAASDHPLKASPVVRSLARTHGIDLSSVQGSGPGGRIIRADVEGLIPGAGEPARKASSQSGAAPTPAAQPAAETTPTKAAPVPAGQGDQRIPLSRIRKVTAKRLSEAALVPAFQLTTVLDATKLGELRAQINGQLGDSGVKISVTDLLVRAAAVTLRAHPEVNAAFDGDAIIRRGRVNVGIAVAIDDGLIVPVVTDADRKSLSEISVEAKDLAKRARAGKLTPDEFSGGTFTISNLGMFGIDNFTAVLNPPEAAILAVGSTVDEPVVVDGEVVVRARTRLTLTVDHRVLDGATGAAFLRDLTSLLSNPLRILV